MRHCRLAVSKRPQREQKMNKRTLIVLSILIISSTPLYAVENGTWAMQTIDTQGNPVSPSLAIDSTGKPRIVYYDQTGQKLKSAVWNGTQWILRAYPNNPEQRNAITAQTK